MRICLYIINSGPPMCNKREEEQNSSDVIKLSSFSFESRQV